MFNNLIERPYFHIGVVPSFTKEVGEIIYSTMSGYKVATLADDNYPVARYVFLPYDGNSNIIERPDAFLKYAKKSQISVAPYKLCEHIIRLKKETKVDISDLLIDDERVLEAFKNGEIDNIPNFGSIDPTMLDMKKVIETAKPQNRLDLLQIVGAVHGTNTWLNNAEKLINDGICTIRDIPAQRDDVFVFLESTCSMSINYTITHHVWKGRYFEECAEGLFNSILKRADVDGWFVPYFSKVKYMFPKAQSVTYLKFSLICMWYKINYPQIYRDVVGNEYNII